MFWKKTMPKWKKPLNVTLVRMPGFLSLLVMVIAIFYFTQAKAAQGSISDISIDSGGLWSNAAERSIQAGGERLIVPERYRTVLLNQSVLKTLMSRAALGGGTAPRSQVIITIPMPNGTSERFQIEESPVMAPELAAKFPEIKTYSGQGIDDPTATIRFDWTPQGFHAMILSVKGRVFVDPYSRNDTSHYISYYTRDHISQSSRDSTGCLVSASDGLTYNALRGLFPGTVQRSSGAQLRTYRLAVAATGEYTAYHGGTVSLGQAAIVTAINRVTGIYEKEVAVRFQLVANNNLLVYTNAATDPYTNNDGNALLAENQTNIDAVIGSANYDVGHVFGTGGGGLASLGVPCDNSWKARGETGSSAPIGDAYWVDYVAHELGHQFGGNHSFNGSVSSCGNRNASTAYEPGSGSTIMAYAGICGSDNLQSNSDAYFHAVSFDEIIAYIQTGVGNSCPVITTTGNNPPVPNAGTGGFYIPANTPFTLTGSATDPDGDALTYNWEEFDLGLTAGPPGNALAAPFFRSWSATTSPSRTFPRLSDLLNNTTATGEVLPNATTPLTFRLTVRDNKANGGGVDYATLNFNVTTAAGPFMVTSPNTAVSWTGNSSQTVTWNVANTTASPVSCPNVGISLSTDGGLTFPITLSASTANNGSKAVTVPNTATTTARIKVYCANNIFFDLSDVNFTIIADTTTTYTLSHTSQTFASTGGTDSVTVTASSSFASWTATSSLSWVTITSGASGTGSGTVTFTVSANTTGDTRTGNITIAGHTFVITQTAAQPVLLMPATYFDTIQAAYNAAVSGSSILVQGVALTETLAFNRNNSITLTGGYDSAFSAVGGTMTTVQGSLTVSGGTLTVANIVIQ